MIQVEMSIFLSLASPLKVLVKKPVRSTHRPRPSKSSTLVKPANQDVRSRGRRPLPPLHTTPSSPVAPKLVTMCLTSVMGIDLEPDADSHGRELPYSVTMWLALAA